MNMCLTGIFRAFRRKNDLQLSHDITSKLKPNADDSQITHVNEEVLNFFEFDKGLGI
jgi:hypothetical protein